LSYLHEDHHSPRVRFIQNLHHDGGRDIYNELIENPDEPDYTSVYRAVWNIVFMPSPPVAVLIDQALQKLQLQRNKYTALHIRSMYNDDRSEDASYIHHQVNCATFIDTKANILAISDSTLALASAVAYGESKENGRIIGRYYDSPPLHIDREDHFLNGAVPESRPPSDYYDTFVDLYLLAYSLCTSRSQGGFAQLATMISSDYRCSIVTAEHQCQDYIMKE
jgi:hypothetical protein